MNSVRGVSTDDMFNIVCKARWKTFTKNANIIIFVQLWNYFSKYLYLILTKKKQCFFQKFLRTHLLRAAIFGLYSASIQSPSIAQTQPLYKNWCACVIINEARFTKHCRFLLNLVSTLTDAFPITIKALPPVEIRHTVTVKTMEKELFRCIFKKLRWLFPYKTPQFSQNFKNMVNWGYLYSRAKYSIKCPGKRLLKPWFLVDPEIFLTLNLHM